MSPATDGAFLVGRLTATTSPTIANTNPAPRSAIAKRSSSCASAGFAGVSHQNATLPSSAPATTTSSDALAGTFGGAGAKKFFGRRVSSVTGKGTDESGAGGGR